MQFLSVGDFEREAHKKMDKLALDYYRSGSDDEITLQANRDAFTEFRIMPRFLRDVSSIKLNNFKLFGDHKITCPIGVSPTAMHKLAHPDGELATAKAIDEFGSIMILSTLSSTPLEESLSLIRRAEAAGFKAIVLTVDAPQFGIRRRDLRNNFKVPGNLMGNFKQSNEQSIHKLDYIDASIKWSDLSWLKQVTKLPVLVKGILTPEDAVLALDFGASAIIVSNHGGRQLDSAPATIEALPRIARAISKRCPILVDGGIRGGADIFKCLALGADMVFVGRPVLWGLACQGAPGVLRVLNILKDELELTMKLSGCQSLSDINNSMVMHKTQLIPKL